MGDEIREFYCVPGEKQREMLNGRMLKREESLEEKKARYTRYRRIS